MTYESGTSACPRWTLNGLAAALLRVMGSELAPEYRDERTVNSVRRRLADTSRATEEIGFTARISIEEGLRRLVDWWRKARLS